MEYLILYSTYFRVSTTSPPTFSIVCPYYTYSKVVRTKFDYIMSTAIPAYFGRLPFAFAFAFAFAFVFVFVFAFVFAFIFAAIGNGMDAISASSYSSTSISHSLLIGSSLLIGCGCGLWPYQ